ncbi:MAG: hypothetical protein K8L99_01875 [Anaerolineae bacterium]|nr:hypothetical protein [Anaerolineae bacterium]
MKRIALFLLIGSILLSGIVLAQGGNLWQISFYNNTGFGGSPGYTASSSFINFNWGGGSPGPGVPSDYFSARMTTSAYFYSGTYRFTITADDEFTLYVNNQQYLNTIGTGQAGKTFTIDVPLLQGYNTVEIEYVEYTGLAYINADWTYIKPAYNATYVPPVGPTTVPPPVSASSVETRFGDFTPCIQQNVHQANCFHSDGSWDSPDLGSIQLEPMIELWGRCDPNRQMTQVLQAGQPAEPSQCSKTAAGWFPRP